MLRVIAETTERVDVFRTRRVRTCLSLSVNKIHPSLHEPTLSASFLPYELCYTGAETREGSRNAAAIMSAPSGSPFADVIQSLAGLHQEHHKALMDMRADQERRFCALVQNQREDRELFRSWMDREVRAGESPTALAPPTHMPVQKMGPQDDPDPWPLWEDRGSMWVAPDGLASAPHPPANRGGAVGGAAAASPEPPGLRRPKASHPPAGRPEPRAAPPALPFAGAWGERPALRDGSPAQGRLPQMAVGRGRRRRPNHRPGGAGAVYCAAPHEDRAVGPVPPSGVAGPGHPTRRGPDGGVPRGWRNPTVRLSLSPLPFFFSPYLLAQVPCRRGSPSPAPMEGRPGSGVDGRESPRQGGGVGRCYSHSPGLSTPIPCPPSRH